MSRLIVRLVLQQNKYRQGIYQSSALYFSQPFLTDLDFIRTISKIEAERHIQVRSLSRRTKPFCRYIEYVIETHG